MKCKTCPICKNKYYDSPAISRKDNKTEICPICGIIEALEYFFRYEENVLDKNKRQD